MVTRLHLAVGIGCALMCQSVSAQRRRPAAQIKKTTTAPVIDGNGSDAVWANANVYGTAMFNVVEGTGAGVPVVPAADFTIEWRGLWDNTNLYVMAKINDDVIVNSLPGTGGPDTSADFNDDGIEFYIDAQNVNNLEYQPEVTGQPFQPTFQFTAIAGWTPTIANDATYLRLDGVTPVSPRPLRVPATLPNTSITHGINSYANSQDTLLYPQDQGSATSGPITVNPAGGSDWTFEASFPWAALQETTTDILARDGIFGFGVAYNDDDDRDARDNQYMWATTRNDLWHVSEGFPDVQLVDAPTKPGDFDTDGDTDGNDFLKWQQGVGGVHNATTLATWKANYAVPATAAAGGVPEPAGAVLVGLGLALLGRCARRNAAGRFRK